MLLSAADRMTVANPTDPQMPAAISAALTSDGLPSQEMPRCREGIEDRVEQADVRIRCVDEVPDDRERRRGDRHRQEHDGLDDRFVTDARGQDRHDQAQEDHQARVEDGPQDVVPDRPGRGKRPEVDEALVAEQADIVVEADPFGEISTPAAVEAQSDRVDRRVDEEHEHQQGRRPQEQESREVEAAARGWGSRCFDRRSEWQFTDHHALDAAWLVGLHEPASFPGIDSDAGGPEAARVGLLRLDHDEITRRPRRP